MKSTISRNLDGIIARSTFNALKHGMTNSLADCIVVEMLSSSQTSAFQALSSKIDSWQLYQLRLSLEKDIATANKTKSKEVDPEIFYLEFVERLISYNIETPRITSLHALHYIAQNSQSATAKILRHYNLDPATLIQEQA